MAKKDGSNGQKIGRGSRSPSSKMYKMLAKAERNRALRIERDRKAKAQAAARKAHATQKPANVLSTPHELRQNRQMLAQYKARKATGGFHMPRCFADLRELVKSSGGSMHLSF